MSDKVSVLVVEDDQAIQGLVEEAFSEGGFETTISESTEEAIRLLAANAHYRAIICDINLAGKLTGWDLARAAREIDPTMPIICMTGTDGEDWRLKASPIASCRPSHSRLRSL